MTLDTAGQHTCSHGPSMCLSDSHERDICLEEIMMLDALQLSEMGKLSLPQAREEKHYWTLSVSRSNCFTHMHLFSPGTLLQGNPVCLFVCVCMSSGYS